MILYAAIYFIGAAFVIPSIAVYMRIFFGKRRVQSRITAALPYLMFPIARTVSFVLYGPPIAGALISLFSLLIISLTYKATWAKRIVAAVSTVAIGLVIYYAIVIAHGVDLPSAFAPFTVYRSLAAILMVDVVIFPVLFLATALISLNFKDIRKNMVVMPVFWVSVFAIPLSSIAALFIIAFAVGLSPFAQFALLCILVGVNVLVFYIYNALSAAHERDTKARLSERESESYLAQLKLMQESVEQTMIVRHDMKAHLSAIGGLAAEGKANEIAAYVGGLLGGMNAAKPYSDTGNPVFDSVINYKLRNAESDGVKPDICMRISRDMNVEPSDIAAILGNLLDNALEAVAHVKDKRIWLDVEHNNDTLFIKTRNAFDSVVRYAGKSDLPATRKSCGGRGLRNVQRIAEKYDGLVKIAHENGVFSVKVLLYLCG